MKYKVGNQVLRIPSHDEKGKASGTVVPWRDVAETCRSLYTVIQQIPDTPELAVDGIAGAGFWGAVFRNNWPDIKLHLNESDENCTPILQENFPEAEVTAEEIQEWIPPKCDIGILEFHKFTLRMLPEFEKVLKRWDKRSKRLIIADGACFGFKFGNLKHYGIDSEEGYYELLNEALEKIISKRITTISKFSNAAIILLENVEKDKIKFITPCTMTLFKGGKRHKQKGTSNMNEGLWAGTGQE